VQRDDLRQQREGTAADDWNGDGGEAVADQNEGV